MFGRFMQHRTVKKLSGLIVLCAFFANFVIADAGAVEVVTLDLYRVMFPAAEEAAFAELDIETFELPSNLGTVKLESKGDSGKFIVHIQDAHCNYAAQKKINEIIAFFVKEYGAENVNLEGGAGAYDLSIFTDIRDEAVRGRVSDHFVIQGLVNGAEDFAINNPEKVKLWGLEDPELYMKNLNVYRSSLQYKGEVEETLKGLTHVMDNLKRQIYSEDLYELDRQYSSFKSNEIKFKEYLSYLIQKAKYHLIDTRAYPNLYLLYQSMEQEEDIDFKKANMQRDDLVERLRGTVSKRALEELVLKTVEFKQKRMSRFEYYDFIVKKAKFADISLDGYPEFQKYFVYISLYHAADRAMVMKEMGQMEDAVKEALYQNDTQRELNVLSKNLVLLVNLFDISLTKDDYNYYRKNRSAFDMRNYSSFIKREAPRYKIRTEPAEDLGGIDRHRGDLEKFFEYSFDRDDKFIENITFTRRANDVAIVVTGGFHTENLCDLYQKRGYSYISIMPNFRTEKGYECPYFDLLAGKEAGMQKVLKEIFSSTALIQIASPLSEGIASEAWEETGVNAFEASVFIQTQIEKGRKVNIQLADGSMLTFGEGKVAVTMPFSDLLEMVAHERDVDVPIKRARDDGLYRDVGQGARNEAAERLKDLALKSKSEVLSTLAENIRNGVTQVDFVDVGDAKFKAHAGGYGIHINSRYADDVVDLIMHEAIAGITRDHFIAKEAEGKDIDKVVSLLVSADIRKPVWEMEEVERLEVARDYMARGEGTAVREAMRRTIDEQIRDNLKLTYSNVTFYLDNYVISGLAESLHLAQNTMTAELLRNKIGPKIDAGRIDDAIADVNGHIAFMTSLRAEMGDLGFFDNEEIKGFLGALTLALMSFLTDHAATPDFVAAYAKNDNIYNFVMENWPHDLVGSGLFRQLLSNVGKDIGYEKRKPLAEAIQNMMAGRPLRGASPEERAQLQKSIAEAEAKRREEEAEKAKDIVARDIVTAWSINEKGEMVSVEGSVVVIEATPDEALLVNQIYINAARLEANGQIEKAKEMRDGAARMIGRFVVVAEEAPAEETPSQYARGLMAPFEETPPQVYGDMESMLEGLPAAIEARLSALGMNSDEISAATDMMNSMREIYREMGLETENYHSHVHNLVVTYAMTMLSEGESPRDAKAAFLAALFHDFHERQNTRTRGDGKVTGTPAYVEETILQLSDLFGLTRYSTPAPGEAAEGKYANYQIGSASTNKTREVLGRFLNTRFPGEKRADVFAEVEAMIRRTDFASNVAPADAEYKTQAVGVRLGVEGRLAVKSELTDADIQQAIDDLESGYQEVRNAAGANKKAFEAAWINRQNNWMNRQLSIEKNYLESLGRIKAPAQRAKIFDLAFRLEKGADQPGAYWMTSPGDTGGALKVVEGLNKEIPEVGADGSGTYGYFLHTEINVDLAALRVMRQRLDPMYRRNYMAVNEFFAEKGKAQDMWNAEKAKMISALGLEGPAAAAPKGIITFDRMLAAAPEATEAELDATQRVIDILALQEGGNVLRMASMDDREKLDEKLTSVMNRIKTLGSLVERTAVGERLSAAEMEQMENIKNTLSLAVYQVLDLTGWEEYGEPSLDSWQNPAVLARAHRVFEGWAGRNERYAVGEAFAPRARKMEDDERREEAERKVAELEEAKARAERMKTAAKRAAFEEMEPVSFESVVGSTPDATDAELDAAEGLIIVCMGSGLSIRGEQTFADRKWNDAKLKKLVGEINELAGYAAKLGAGVGLSKEENDRLNKLRVMTGMTVYRMFRDFQWEGLGTPSENSWRNLEVLARSRKVFEGWIKRNEQFAIGEWAARAVQEMQETDERNARERRTKELEQQWLQSMSGYLAEARGVSTLLQDRLLRLAGWYFLMDEALGKEAIYNGLSAEDKATLERGKRMALAELRRSRPSQFWRGKEVRIEGFQEKVDAARMEVARQRTVDAAIERMTAEGITPSEWADYRKVRDEAVKGTDMVLAANRVQRMIDPVVMEYLDTGEAGPVRLAWLHEQLDVAFPVSLSNSAFQAIRDYRQDPARNMAGLKDAADTLRSLEGYTEALSRRVLFRSTEDLENFSKALPMIREELRVAIGEANLEYRERLASAYGMLNAADMMTEEAVMEGALDWDRLNAALNQAFNLERDNARYRAQGVFGPVLSEIDAAAFGIRFASTKQRIYNFVNAKRDYINGLDNTPDIFRALGVTLGTTPEDRKLASISPEDLKARIVAVHALGYSIYNGVGLALLRNPVDELRQRADVRNAFESAETLDEAVAAMEMAGNKVKGMNKVHGAENGLARLGEFVDSMRRSGVDIYGHNLTLLEYGPEAVYEKGRLLEKYGMALNKTNLTTSEEKIRGTAVQKAGTIAAVLDILKDGKLATGYADPAEIDRVDAELKAEVMRMDLSTAEWEAVLIAMKEEGYENLKGLSVPRLREIAISRAESVDRILDILNADRNVRSAQVVVFLGYMEVNQGTRAEEGKNHAAARLDVMVQDLARHGLDVYGRGTGLEALNANLVNVLKGIELWDVQERKSKGVPAERAKIKKGFNDIQQTLYASFAKFVETDAGKRLLAETVRKEGLTGDDIDLKKPENTPNRLRVMEGLKNALIAMTQYGVQQDMMIDQALPSYTRQQRYADILDKYIKVVMGSRDEEMRANLQSLKDEDPADYDFLFIRMIKAHLAKLKAEGKTWKHEPFLLGNIDPAGTLLKQYKSEVERITEARERMRAELSAEIRGPASRTEAPEEKPAAAEEEKSDESAAVANGALKDALESAQSLEKLQETIGEEVAMDDNMQKKLNAALDYLYDQLKRGKIEGEDLNMMVELMTGSVAAEQAERDAAREGIISSVYLFNAKVEGEENYLLGFNKFDRIGLTAELVRSLSARELAELLFHELYETGIGHEAIYGKYNRAESIQGKIFGMANPLKDSLRSFINMKTREFEIAKAVSAGERPVEVAKEAAEGVGIDMESRKVSDIKAGEEIERRTDPVKIVVAGVYDLNNPDAFRSIEKAVRKFNSEIKTKFGEQADNQQIIVFRIEKGNPAATAENYRKAMDRAMKELDRLPEEAKARLVSYTPQMEGMELADNVMDEARPEFAQYRTDPRVTLVRDGYTDAFDRGEARAIDIAARFILGRQIAFCYNADNDAARMEGLKRVRDLLSMLSGEEIAATLNTLDDLKNYLANNIIKINPIDYEEIRDYEDMQLAVAVSL